MHGLQCKNNYHHFSYLLIYFRKAVDNTIKDYEQCLRKAKEFENPNYDILYNISGLDIKDNFTMISSLRYEFPREEYAKELRQVQASKWAFR